VKTEVGSGTTRKAPGAAGNEGNGGREMLQTKKKGKRIHTIRCMVSYDKEKRNTLIVALKPERKEHRIIVGLKKTRPTRNTSGVGRGTQTCMVWGTSTGKKGEGLKPGGRETIKLGLPGKGKNKMKELQKKTSGVIRIPVRRNILHSPRPLG